MARIGEATWQGHEAPGRFLGLCDTENLLARSLFLHPRAIYKQLLGCCVEEFDCGAPGPCSGHPEALSGKGQVRTLPFSK